MRCLPLSTGVDHQDTGEDFSDEHASVDGDPSLDPVSMLAMQKQMCVMQKQRVRMTVKSVQQSKGNVVQESAVVGPASTTSSTSGETQDYSTDERINRLAAVVGNA